MKQADIDRHLKWRHVSRDTFGSTLKRLRASSGIPRLSLAVRAGIEDRHLADLETDKFPPSYRDLKRLAAVFSVGEDELLAAVHYLTREQKAPELGDHDANANASIGSA